MTESEKRAKILALQAEFESGSPVQSLHASTHSSLQSAFDHAVRVEKLYEGMGKRGYTVDDLIDAYNRGCQQAFDFSLKFFFSAYAIALNENGRDIMEALECVSKCREMQFRADLAAFQGDFPQA